MNINVTISERTATAGGGTYICGNADYTITFAFDAEWAAFTARVARFTYRTRTGVDHIDVPFSGNSVIIPAIGNIDQLFVGVYASDGGVVISTTTPAIIPCAKSILCGVETTGHVQVTTGTSCYWFTGTAVTGTGDNITAEVEHSKYGDMYLNNETMSVYSCKNANTWKYECNISGAVYMIGAEINSSNHLIVEMSNGTDIDCGAFPVGVTPTALYYESGVLKMDLNNGTTIVSTGCDFMQASVYDDDGTVATAGGIVAYVTSVISAYDSDIETLLGGDE